MKEKKSSEKSGFILLSPTPHFSTGAVIRKAPIVIGNIFIDILYRSWTTQKWYSWLKKI